MIDAVLLRVIIINEAKIEGIYPSQKAKKEILDKLAVVTKVK
jgi:hypothetical protein